MHVVCASKTTYNKAARITVQERSWTGYKLDARGYTVMKTRLFKYIEKFTTKKGKLSDNKIHSDIFHIHAQNIDCGYSLEPPRRGASNEYPQSKFLAK